MLNLNVNVFDSDSHMGNVVRPYIKMGTGSAEDIKKKRLPLLILSAEPEPKQRRNRQNDLQAE